MPKKILVTYTSKYGSTKRYAEWIAAELGADLSEAGKVNPETIGQYDVIVHGGGLYAGGIAGAKRIARNPCKNLVVFTVGLGNPNTSDYSKIIDMNLTPEQLSKTKLFHLRGGIDYKRLGPIHKAMMAMMKASIVRKPESERAPDDGEFLATYNKAVNFEDKSTIAPLAAYVKAL